MIDKKILAKIQNLPIDEEFKITRGISGINLSKPIDIADIVLKKSIHSCDFTPSDVPFDINRLFDKIDCYAYKSTYSFLGTMLFELLFSNQSYIEFKIQNPKSELKQLFVHIDRESRPSVYYHLDVEQIESYQSFYYFPQEINKFALSPSFQTIENKYHKKDVPSFFLGCSNKKYRYSEEFNKKADQLVILTKVGGLTRLAELLLNIGVHSNSLFEISLENPIYGFGGVGESSLEARFHLPSDDSLVFFYDKLENL